MITKKICPNCGSENVEMIAGGTTGNWMCRDCGYQGNIAEKEIVQSQAEGNNDTKNH